MEARLGMYRSAANSSGICIECTESRFTDCISTEGGSRGGSGSGREGGSGSGREGGGPEGVTMRDRAATDKCRDDNDEGGSGTS